MSTLVNDVVASAAGAVVAALAAVTWAGITRPGKQLNAFETEARINRAADEKAFRDAVQQWQRDTQHAIEALSLQVSRMDVLWSVMEPRERDDTRKLIRAVLPATHAEEKEENQ